MKPQLREQCHNRWRSILSLFGVDAKTLNGKQHPCPVCGGRDRFRFDDKDGNGTSFCNACGARDGVQLVMAVADLNFQDAAASIREKLNDTVVMRTRALPDAHLKRMKNELWRQSTLIGGDMAEAYLRSRGFSPPYSSELRFVESARVTNHPSRGNLPALLARVTGPDGRPVNIHRTFLENGRKFSRAMMPGTTPAGSAIRLSKHSGILGVAEGIETALAAARDFSIPVWSLMNSTMMEQFIIPEGVVELHVFGDNDTKFGGQASAYKLAHRACVQKRVIPVVRVYLPNEAGTDWADVSSVQAA